MIKKLLGLLGAGNLLDDLVGYIETKIELVKLDLIEGISKVFASLLILFIFLLLSSVILFFLSLGLAHYINEVVGSSFVGFIWVAGGVSTLLILAALLKRKGVFRSMIYNYVEEALYHQEEEEDNE